ncbi:hypothetical protein LOTGIDRAFT_153158 [Lottia gigantea]|uniref:Uncharacterized protein n=1 Tax=Lottia gigantea TaxID=225164 RepID=V3ZQM1_LOTGI|nr:hypothetical protein LOTGIDRAFT_153158 [Lottia gigantea]ESO93703.1 hypothetical protein LOTGIDRAFT_153158 [Lottia gigantea]
MKARTVLADNQDNLEPSTLHRIYSVMFFIFYSSKREFYATMVKNMVNKFPLDNELLNGISIVHPGNREASSFENVAKINKRFNIVQNVDQLQEELVNLQLTDNEDIPHFELDKLDQF